jgi:signal transduction histidine kinase
MSASEDDDGGMDERTARLIDEEGLGAYTLIIRAAFQSIAAMDPAWSQERARTEPTRDGIGVSLGPSCPLRIPPWLREDWPDDIRFAHISRGEDQRIVIRPGRKRWSQEALQERARIQKERAASEDEDERVRLAEELFELRDEQPVVPIDPREEREE